MSKVTIGIVDIPRRTRNPRKAAEEALQQMVSVLNRHLLFTEDGEPVSFTFAEGSVTIWQGLELKEP